MPTIAQIKEVISIVDQLQDLQTAITKMEAQGEQIVNISLDSTQLRSIDKRLAQFAEAEFINKIADIRTLFYTNMLNTLTKRRDALLAQLLADYNVTP